MLHAHLEKVKPGCRKPQLRLCKPVRVRPTPLPWLSAGTVTHTSFYPHHTGMMIESLASTTFGLAEQKDGQPLHGTPFDNLLVLSDNVRGNHRA